MSKVVRGSNIMIYDYNYYKSWWPLQLLYIKTKYGDFGTLVWKKSKFLQKKVLYWDLFSQMFISSYSNIGSLLQSECWYGHLLQIKFYNKLEIHVYYVR